MRFRFLYLNEAGEEVEVGGVEELRACVAMGRVDENTLLYDSVTREWAPARAHSAYRMLADESSDPLPRGTRSDPASGHIRVDEERSGDAEELPELTPAPESDLPDTQALFLERQERLRRMEEDEPPPAPDRADFHIVEPADDLADRAAEAGRQPPQPPTPAERPPSADLDDTPDLALDRTPDEVPVPRVRSGAPPRPIRRSPVGQRRRRLTAVGGAAVVVGVAAWAMLRNGDGAESARLPAASEPAPRTTEPSSDLPDAAAVAQGSAFQEMVLAMDSVRGAHDLMGGPEGWLDGHYLATASAYPHVANYWRRYRDYVSDLRAQDTALFRAGFIERMRQDGLEGPVVQMRLARALDEFRSSQPEREALYQGMDVLAQRALALHALLLERESDVEYDPVQPGSVSRDPVIEAFPRDAELRDQIWDLLDDIFEAMDVVQGGVPGTRDQLGDAALREILQSGGGRR
jgi:hypothetical protein